MKKYRIIKDGSRYFVQKKGGIFRWWTNIDYTYVEEIAQDIFKGLCEKRNAVIRESNWIKN